MCSWHTRQANARAFAAVCDRTVGTWGYPAFGGHSAAVQSTMKKMQEIQANGRAFAAILAHGSVRTWGVALHGGDTLVMLPGIS